jgi:hypothetical protein
MLKDKIAGSNRLPKIFFFFLVCVSLYLLFFNLPFPDTDDLAYKQAGVSLFRGLGFSAPGLTGLVPGVERIFLFYPPAYPFLYGLWFAIFGFSISSSLTLSLLICCLVTFVQYRLFKVVTDKEPQGYVYGLLFFSWTLVLKAVHRPDALLALLVLSLFLLVMKSKEHLSTKHKIGIALLIGLSLATSFFLGMLSIAYIGMVFISARRFSIRAVKNLIFLFALGFILLFLLWWIPGHSDPPLFKLQLSAFTDGVFNLNDLISQLKQGADIHYKHGFTVFYLPLLLFLIFISIRGMLSEHDRAKRKTLIARFVSIVIIWLLISAISLRRYLYLELFYTLFICGVVFPIIGHFLNSRVAKRILYLCLFVAFLPFLKTTLLFPLTWNTQDSYTYNKKLILQNIPRGSKIVTPPVFWYVFDRDFQVFDPSCSRQAIYHCDYVLLAGGGSGKAGAPLMDLYGFEPDYFKRNFIKQLSTMSDQPNKLFGMPISKSRWCYRFQLYKRR